jgi:hypothetical protein
VSSDSPPVAFELYKFLAGVLGSVVSMRFIVGTILQRMLMLIGGSALSYFASDYVVHWVGNEKSLGLAGFLIGLFGMVIASKLFEGINSLNMTKIFGDLWSSFKKKVLGIK